MSRATPDDQLKFLLNCVKYSNNGKIDFVEVAKECGIVSKGAAAKRYERLMKANGIHPNGGPSNKPSTPPAPRDRSKTTTAKATTSKKRKTEEIPADIKADTGDDGMLAKMKPESKDTQYIKPEPAPDEHKSATVKSPPATRQTPTPTIVRCSPSPQPQQLFHTPQMAYPQPRHYHPHVAQYQGPLMPLPQLQHQSTMSGYRYPLQRHSVLPQQAPSLDDTSMFEDFCTPELFEQRTFLEMPPVEPTTPITPPPQEVTMKDLSTNEKPEEKPQKRLEENLAETPTEKQAEKPGEKKAGPQSGRRLSESILIID